MTEARLPPFIDALRRSGRLVTVSNPVEPSRDLAAVAWSIFHSSRKAALFNQVERRAEWRTAARLLADRAQWAAAFSQTDGDLLATLRARATAAVRAVETEPGEAPVCQVDRGETADAVPLVLEAEHDPGPQLTAVALVRDPDAGRTLVGLARLLNMPGGQLSLVDVPPGLMAVRRKDAAAGLPTPIALAVGANPALYLAAAMGLASPKADIELACALGGEPLRIVRAHGTILPADAEYALVGELDDPPQAPGVAISNILGTYSLPQHALRLANPRVLRRRDPIHWCVDGAGTLALATEALVWSHIQHIEGGLDVIDVFCFPCAAGLAVAVKLRPRVQGQAKTALLGALSGPAYWVKLAIGVDEDIDVASLRDVVWSVASRTHAEIDVGMVEGVRMLHADVSAPLSGGDQRGERVGTRWFIDSTMPALSKPEERAGFERAMPRNLAKVTLHGRVLRP